jgi:hypothetical protein
MINWQVPAPETPHERPRRGRHARTKTSRRTLERILRKRAASLGPAGMLDVLDLQPDPRSGDRRTGALAFPRNDAAQLGWEGS